MIASLRGTMIERGEGWCVIECSGVGYLVHVSGHTLAELPAVGGAVRVRTRQIVREDAVQIFGFTDDDEARLFDLLIAVNGVGPKLALAALSGLQPSALARAIRDQRVAALVAVPGIGKKTAERLVVELRDKLDFLAGPGPARDERGAPSVVPRSDAWEDAVTALVNLGLSPAQAQESLRAVSEDDEALSLQELLRRALSRHGRSVAASR